MQTFTKYSETAWNKKAKC